MASGSVTFSDGIQKKRTLDQFGRLGLTGGEEGYKPSDEDVMEFQKQLDAKLRGKDSNIQVKALTFFRLTDLV